MKTIKVYSDKDCVIRYGVWPEEPDFKALGKDKLYGDYKFFTGFKDRDIKEQHEAALQKAKDESVPFANAIMIKLMLKKQVISKSPDLLFIQPDTFYDIEFEGEIEVIEVCAHDSCPVYAGCDHCKEPIKVARLLPSKEETNSNKLDKSLITMESKVCKVEDKPDIFQLAIKYQERAHPSKRALMGAGYYDGYDDCWTDHVETLKQELEDAILEKQVANTSIEFLSEEVKELEAEITRLKDEKAP